MSRIVAFLTLFGCMLSHPASGQGDNKVGLLIASPAALGLEWEIGPRLALRPDFTFTKTTNSTVGATEDPSVSKSAAVSLGLVWYVRDLRPLRMYASPRLGHLLSRAVNRATTSQTTVSGAFGAQYDLGGSFGIFAEAGLAYARTRQRSGLGDSVFMATSLGNRTTLGAIVYF